MAVAAVGAALIVTAGLIFRPSLDQTLEARARTAWRFAELDRPLAALEILDGSVRYATRRSGEGAPETVAQHHLLATAALAGGPPGYAVATAELSVDAATRLWGREGEKVYDRYLTLALAYGAARDPRAPAYAEQTLASAWHVLGSDHPVSRELVILGDRLNRAALRGL